METVRIILELILGCSTLLGFILYGKANRRIKDAEAEKSEAEASEVEDHRFDNLLKLVDSLTSRLSSLNATVDKHIDRNRELSDRLYKSETELNRANERIIKLTEEKESERSLKEHYKLWHCRKEGCAGRMPPNKKLNGLKYEHPKRAVK
jgi:chromosome segregation ATPase